MTHPSPKRNMVPKAVLMRSGLVSLTTARPVNTAQPKTTVNSARPMTNVFNKAHLTVRRPINNKTTTKNSNFNKRVNTVSGKNVNTARPKAVLNAVKGNQVNAVKASACWVWKPKTKGNLQMDLQDQGVIDSGCSRHMIGNMSYLTDFEEIDEGYVAFGGNPKGGKITSRGDVGKKVDENPRKDSEDDILLVQIYVDDIIFGSTKKELCNDFKKLMHEKFQISSMRELTFFLGLQVQQKKDGIFISQDKYVDKILKKFEFTEVKTASTPMETQKPLLKDEHGEEMDVHMYRSMIGSLMYLTSSRPNIMFVVYAYARYQVNLKVSHLHVVKKIFRYLKGQPKLELWYPKDSLFDLVAYIDSDYAGASLDRKSTTGGCQFLGCRLISWQCKKQTVIANSITKAEYVAALSCCGQVLWIQNQLLDYGYNFMHTKIFIDNNNLLTKAFDVVGQGAKDTMGIYCSKLAKVESSDDELSLGEDASKQGRKIHDIDADEDITLENVHDAKMFDVNDLHDEEVFVEKEIPIKEVSDVGKVNAASIATTVSAAATITTKEITFAQALMEIKTSKPKAKGIVFKEPSISTTTTTKPSQIKVQDKEAKRLQDEFDEEERLAREKDEANIALTKEYDDIQAKIDADYQLAQRLQAEEQDELTDAKKARLFVQLLEKRRKYFAAKRAEEQRNKPPTKAQ
ncbi:putative ribonuclease H-like domain-containing protein [Tanacetum coccineum]